MQLTAHIIYIGECCADLHATNCADYLNYYIGECCADLHATNCAHYLTYYIGECCADQPTTVGAHWRTLKDDHMLVVHVFDWQLYLHSIDYRWAWGYIRHISSTMRVGRWWYESNVLCVWIPQMCTHGRVSICGRFVQMNISYSEPKLKERWLTKLQIDTKEKQERY